MEQQKCFDSRGQSKEGFEHNINSMHTKTFKNLCCRTSSSAACNHTRRQILDVEVAVPTFVWLQIISCCL